MINWRYVRNVRTDQQNRDARPFLHYAASRSDFLVRKSKVSRAGNWSYTSDSAFLFNVTQRATAESDSGDEVERFYLLFAALLTKDGRPLEPILARLPRISFRSY